MMPCASRIFHHRCRSSGQNNVICYSFGILTEAVILWQYSSNLFPPKNKKSAHKFFNSADSHKGLEKRRVLSALICSIDSRNNMVKCLFIFFNKFYIFIYQIPTKMVFSTIPFCHLNRYYEHVRIDSIRYPFATLSTFFC